MHLLDAVAVAVVVDAMLFLYVDAALARPIVHVAGALAAPALHVAIAPAAAAVVARAAVSSASGSAAAAAAGAAARRALLERPRLAGVADRRRVAVLAARGRGGHGSGAVRRAVSAS